jgi:S-adenosylmethionine decarboxylase
MDKMASAHHYEGSEKRFELVAAPGAAPLRRYGPRRWARVAARAGAKVLSRLAGEYCDACLLSESSLFVYDDRVAMSTCGRTTLADAVSEILSFIPRKDVRTLVYERKNEYFPHRQPSSFLSDAEKLRRLLPGRAYRFGHSDERHLFLYHYGRRAPRSIQPSAEVLMHGVRPAPGLSKALRKLLPGFKTDEHFFRPRGYSMNALSGRLHCAVHVTPDGPGSYASFETNGIADDRVLDGVLKELLRLFRPRSFDLMLTQVEGAVRAPDRLGYRPGGESFRKLPCGRRMVFRHYAARLQAPAEADELAL